MITLLWKAFFEDDVDNFLSVLASYGYSKTTDSAKGKTNERTAFGSLGTSPGMLGTHGRPTESRLPSGSRVKPSQGYSLSKGGINIRDGSGLALLHHVASSPSENAPAFAIGLLDVPTLDLYIQDAENGWTALHRALYFGNVTIAHAILDLDYRIAADSSRHLNSQAGCLIKIKDREGNSPFDLYAATIAPRSIIEPSGTALIASFSEDDDGPAQGTSGDHDDEEKRDYEIRPSTNIGGDELFVFGSNQNLTLGLGDEDDRQYPERIQLNRPARLARRLAAEHQFHSRRGHSSKANSAASYQLDELPACIKFKPVIIQDIQMSKLHTAILTSDVEANLYVCGFGPGGRLGTGDENTRFHYVSVCGGALVGKKVVHVSLGQNHTIAITSLGETTTWGNNTFGQLGYSTPGVAYHDEAKQLLPKQLFGILKKECVVGAAASRFHTVVHTTHSLYTFGKSDGQLGLVDSDARSLTVQDTPRKIAASLFTSTIQSVAAIDHATICLLETHEVWIFANYGYTKLLIDTDTIASHFLRTSYSLTRYGEVNNHVTKIVAKRDTICALTSMGEVFTVSIKSNLETTSPAASTTNPAKIRNALSAPIRIWSNTKRHLRVRDVDVGQDGSIVICTEAGSVWRRIKRPKIASQRLQSSSFDTRPKDYKFSRVPALTHITAVRANAHGAYAAVRRDCDVLKEQVTVGPPTIWLDLFPLLPFHGLDTRADMESTNPPPRFWVGAPSANDTAGYRRAALTFPDISAALKTFFLDMDPVRLSTYDLRVAITGSNVVIPVNEFVFASRSSVLRQALSKARKSYFYNIPEVLTIEYDVNGMIVVNFINVDPITLYNLVLYCYTDTVADVWHHTRHSPKRANRFRQVRVELMRVASSLGMRPLESAVRLMTEPAKILQDDLEVAFMDETFFESSDVEITLEGQSVHAHSALLSRRCPFFEGLLAGRTGGGWLRSRQSTAGEDQNVVNVDLSHIRPSIFQYVLRYLYADTNETLFDHVVADSVDGFVDLLLEVLSVANELMLDRLSEICQKVLAQYITTRNICQLVNAIAPCSVTSFKDAALEYICMNMEAMLENNLLGELDEDLMLELDTVIRENQLTHQPISRSGRADADLFERYPHLPSTIDLGREDSLESIEARAARYNDEHSSASTSKGKGKSQAERTNAVQSPRMRRQSSKHLVIPSESLKAQAKIIQDNVITADNDIPTFFDEDRSGAVEHEAAEPGLAARETGIMVTVPMNGLTKVEQQAKERQPWAAAAFTSPKLGLKDIMTQASQPKASALSTALNNRSPSSRSPISGTSIKISQKDRKRQQQEAVQKKPQPEPFTLTSTSPETEPRGSPWQLASRGPKPSMKDIFEVETEAPATPTPTLNMSQRSSGPSHTLRQTVPGNVRSSSNPMNIVEPIAELRRASSTSAQRTPPRPVSSKSTSAQLPSYQSPPSSTPPVKIQSIRHIPAPRPHYDPDDPYAANFSMSDIVSQQQMEKNAIKEAVAKRNLQEIQEEQAFQEWWDEESRRVQGETAKEETSHNRAAGRGGRNRRARGANSVRGGAPRQQSDDIGRQRSQNLPVGRAATDEPAVLGPGEKGVALATEGSRGRGKGRGRGGAHIRGKEKGRSSGQNPSTSNH